MDEESGGYELRKKNGKCRVIRHFVFCRTCRYFTVNDVFIKDWNMYITDVTVKNE